MNEMYLLILLTGFIVLVIAGVVVWLILRALRNSYNVDMHIVFTRNAPPKPKKTSSRKTGKRKKHPF